MIKFRTFLKKIMNDNDNELFICAYFLQLAIILCTACCDNYKLNYTASRLQELAG